MPNTRRFGFTSTFNDATPVTLPPGRLKAGDERGRHRITPVSKTIGIVVVAAFAASAPAIPPADTMDQPRRSGADVVFRFEA
jgi:hypothetical protein